MGIGEGGEEPAFVVTPGLSYACVKGEGERKNAKKVLRRNGNADTFKMPVSIPGVHLIRPLPSLLGHEFLEV